MSENTTRVTGEITFEDGTQPFSGATLIVRLEDVSLMDVAANLVTQQVMRDVAYDGTPIPFELHANSTNDNTRYRVSAHVSFDGSEEIAKGDFITMQNYGVLTHGNPNRVQVQVRRV